MEEKGGRRSSEEGYWPNMKEDVEDYVSTCFTCLQDKTERSHPAGLLEPLPILERPWESLSFFRFHCGIAKSGGVLKHLGCCG